MPHAVESTSQLQEVTLKASYSSSLSKDMNKYEIAARYF